MDRYRNVSDAYGSGGAGSEGYSFTGSYEMMPADTPLAPARVTHVPVVHGPQTARVVGEGEIDCDDYGRILVHFPWDLEGAHSMRCRVSQNWASKGWGGMVIPRIGMEVDVEFLEGDPDKPLVTGCVYNGKNDVPYELPRHKTRSTFKTDTHQGKGFNELRFEDKAREEEIYVHAQKDRNEKIENNQSERINVNKVESTGHNKASEIGNNCIDVVDGDMELRIGPSNRGAVTPTGADAEVEGIKTSPILLGEPGKGKIGSGNLSVSVERTKAQVIWGDHTEIVEGNKDTDVQQRYAVRVRNTVQIKAGDEIELICGNSRIKLTASGTIELNGRKILELGDQLIRLQSDVVKIN